MKRHRPKHVSASMKAHREREDVENRLCKTEGVLASFSPVPRQLIRGLPSEIRQALRAAGLVPNKHNCFGNAFTLVAEQRLVPLFYVEGTVSDGGRRIDHAWVRMYGQDIDITLCDGTDYDPRLVLDAPALFQFFEMNECMIPFTPSLRRDADEVRRLIRAFCGG
jgi:hypothetical protein